MNITGKDNAVLAMDVARDDQDLLVVTEGGYGKRTPVGEYRLTSRGAKGVKTITFSESRGGLAAALVVREHQDLVFISYEGMVQRTGVRGINQYGRAAQGVKVMNVRDEDTVSAVALVVESQADDEDPAALAETVATEGPIELDASGGTEEAGPKVPEEHAPDPSAMLSEDAAKAAEAALDDESEALDEPAEVDLDETDGPPTPDAS
jgi:DNA gyrase subunit A